MSSTRLPSSFSNGVLTPVHQGECLVSDRGEVVFSTVLGSCISACVHDPVAGVGGMNHFLLAQPGDAMRDRFGASARYGAFAMEQLINMVLSQGTGIKANLVFKVFGGGSVHPGIRDVGAGNADFVRTFLANERYLISGEDIGGRYARRVVFRPRSGKVAVRRLGNADGTRLVEAELAIAARTGGAPAGGAEVELF